MCSLIQLFITSTSNLNVEYFHVKLLWSVLKKRGVFICPSTTVDNCEYYHQTRNQRPKYTTLSARVVIIYTVVCTRGVSYWLFGWYSREHLIYSTSSFKWDADCQLLMLYKLTLFGVIRYDKTRKFDILVNWYTTDT